MSVRLFVTKDIFPFDEQVIASYIQQNKKSTICFKCTFYDI